MIELRRGGATIETLAARYGLTVKRVQQILGETDPRDFSERNVEMVALREDGWTLQHLADRYGVTRERVRQIVGSNVRQCENCGKTLTGNQRKWCSERCRKTCYQGTCERCGGPTSGAASGHRKTPRLCKSCAGKVLGETQRQRFAPHRRQIEQWWAEGLKGKEIAQRLGLKQVNVSSLRARGYNLPHRRSPEAIENITVGSHERLERARQIKTSEADVPAGQPRRVGKHRPGWMRRAYELSQRRPKLSWPEIAEAVGHPEVEVREALGLDLKETRPRRK
jgi:transcriptional regulator